MALGDALRVMVAAWKWRNLRPQWHTTKQLGTHCVPDVDRFHVYLSSICCFSLLANHICQVSLCVSTDGKSRQTVQSKVQCRTSTTFFINSDYLCSIIGHVFLRFSYELSLALTPLLAYLRQHQSQEWISLCMQKGLKRATIFASVLEWKGKVPWVYVCATCSPYHQQHCLKYKNVQDRDMLQSLVRDRVVEHRLFFVVVQFPPLPFPYLPKSPSLPLLLHLHLWALFSCTLCTTLNTRLLKVKQPNSDLQERQQFWWSSKRKAGN